jgi:hypothetical protein
MVRKAVENVQLLCFSGRDLSFDTFLRDNYRESAAASPPGSGAYHIRGIEGVAGGHGMDCPAAGAFGLKCFHFELPRTASADNLQGDRQKLIRETHHSHFIHYLIGRAEAGRTSVMHI